MTCADPKDARIAELESQLTARDVRIAELESQVFMLTTQLQAAFARIAKLEAKLGQNSTNSSKPLSSDPSLLPVPAMQFPVAA